MFDEIVIGIGVNHLKKTLFDESKRLDIIRQAFAGEPRVKAMIYNSLTIDFAKSVDAQFILRGLRTVADFEYERTISQMNASMHHPIETIFLITSPEYSGINSTVVREIIKYGGDASVFLPKEIKL